MTMRYWAAIRSLIVPQALQIVGGYSSDCVVQMRRYNRASLQEPVLGKESHWANLRRSR